MTMGSHRHNKKKGLVLVRGVVCAFHSSPFLSSRSLRLIPETSVKRDTDGVLWFLCKSFTLGLENEKAVVVPYNTTLLVFAKLDLSIETGVS